MDSEFDIMSEEQIPLLKRNNRDEDATENPPIFPPTNVANSVKLSRAKKRRERSKRAEERKKLAALGDGEESGGSATLTWSSSDTNRLNDSAVTSGDMKAASSGFADDRGIAQSI